MLVTAMFGSKFMMSVGMFGLIGLSLLQLDLYPFRLRISTEFFKAWRRLYQNKAFWAYSWIFWMPIITYFWSNDVGEWYNRNRIHVPFLALGIAFLANCEWNIKSYHVILKFTVYLSIFSVVLVLYHYFDPQDNHLKEMERGHALWMPINHIRYSLLMAYTSLLACYFSVKYWKKQHHKKALYWAIIGVGLIVYVHFIAVRSGMMAMYAAFLVWLLIELVQVQKKWTLLGLLLIFLLIPMVSIYKMPTLKRKIDYMSWDIQQFIQGKKSISSDSRRLHSMAGGWEVYKSSPWIGVGVGDLKDEMTQYFEKQNAEYVFFPHNQYLFFLAATGILGFIVFLFCNLFPIFYQRAYMLTPLMGIQVIMLLSFFVENTIENAIGVAIYAFFAIMGWRSVMANRRELNT